MKSEYPKKLYHPNALPAVLSEGVAMGGGHGHGAHLPPVTVGGPDDEAWYAARGYIEGDQVLEPVVRQKERENIRMRKSPPPEDPDTFEYPKYVGDKIVQSAEEEAAILAEMNKPKPATPPMIEENHVRVFVDPAELEEFRAWKAAKRAKADLERVEVTLPSGRPPLTEEQKQRRRDNLARARAMRRKNLETK